jgi:NAD(P)-dependent dehydrogenase (short-subunit alcohol dehydrogenase family)
MDRFRIDGKTAWITGGSKGLGLQMAHALADAGANIAINSRHSDEAQDAAQSIAERHGVRAIGGSADVTSSSDIAAFVARIENELGPPDVLVNSAGINIRLPTVEMTEEDWRRVLDINLTGPFLCTKAVLPGMMERGWGRIIHMSSMLGEVGLAGRPSYTASKGGLMLLTRTQALEAAGSGVTVNAICPGPFATEINRPLLEDPEKYRALAAKIPLGRWGELHEIEGAVVYLASPAASYVTGSALFVDGGWTAQ